jgi:single-stranded DNA-specific DHH superfamily exonuclease
MGLICPNISAQTPDKILLVPDKDADGLAAGVILHRTLTALGVPSYQIETHLVGKGSNIHSDAERLAMKETIPKYVIVVDQGSRAGPPIVDAINKKCLIIDHHLSDEFPENSMV